MTDADVTGVRRRLTRAVVAIRGLLAEPAENPDDPHSRVILRQRPEGDPRPEAPALRLDGLNTEAPPDELVRQVRDALEAYRDAQRRAPDVIVLPGVGVFDVERNVASETLPLAGKTAVVTGAAGAIGAGICRGLLKKGCRVAATDIAPANLQSLVDELRRTQNLPPDVACDRVIGVVLDVTDRRSVEDGFGDVARTWGGIDIVIVNAGIAMVSSLLDMDLEAFRRLERVNVDGALLTLGEAGRCMKAQGTGGDIVLVSTKNVFAPGAQFGAYSATKAAAHQLARIASLEFAAYGVRVNMVSPDAVFGEGERRSGLWTEVGPSRMKARGLDEKGLEEYYRSRNLLKARVTPEHVANAVLFFVTRQTPTTGATIPVDGGLPDSTPR